MRVWIVAALVLTACSNHIDGDPSRQNGGDDVAVADGDDPVPSCSAGTHVCGSACVANTAIATCGDRCSPCSVPDNGQATCDGAVCGAICADGFSLCLGECVAGTCATSFDANTWVKLTSNDTGTRRNASMFYLESTNEYVLNGGSITTGGAHPYDVQGLRLVDGAWRNHHPFAKAEAWGPEVGNTNAPEPTNEQFSMADSQGVVRPSWGVYPSMPTYFQYAYNPTSERQVFFVKNRTFVYDAAARTYTFPTTDVDPAGGPTKAPLIWGAMTYDSVADQVLLFGGANMRTPSGDPGTWLYDVATATWREVTGPRPPPRALSRMVTDPGRRKALLFGGDHLSALVADTWAFDFASETWEELAPTQAPSPRAGHHLLYLPTSGRIVLVGGYGYSSELGYYAPRYASRPMEIWRFDWATPTWELVKHFAEADSQPVVGATTFTAAAAAGRGDVVVLHVKNGGNDAQNGETWAIRVDPSVTDAAGSATYGGLPSATEVRTGAYDPAWYTTGWPAPSPSAFASDLAGRATNAWTEVTVPNRPDGNRDWGTAVTDPARKVIYRWSGGHSAHCGTDVLEWSYENNRYAIGYAPEFPLDFDFTNDQIPGGQWSFGNRPWMAVHTYRMYTYAPSLDRVVVHKNGVTYFYDPATHDFEAEHPFQDLGGSQYDTVLAATDNSVYAWSPGGVFRLNGDKSWAQVTTSGATLPQIRSDRTTMVFDSTRNRLLLVSSLGAAGAVFALDPMTGAVSALSPAGADIVPDEAFQREAVYLPGPDILFFGTSIAGRSLVYDCGDNRWYGYAVDPGALQPSFYDVSLGLVTDGSRIFGMNTNSRIFTLQIDDATVDKLAY